MDWQEIAKVNDGSDSQTLTAALRWAHVKSVDAPEKLGENSGFLINALVHLLNFSLRSFPAALVVHCRSVFHVSPRCPPADRVDAVVDKRVR